MGDQEWINDFVIAFLRSPPWTVPLNDFIDANCIVFDGEDENKFVYTDLHKEFIELVETTLTENLKEMGLTDQQFVAVMRESIKDPLIEKLVFGQILAADDFLTFKKLMQKRNVQLELEALEALSQGEIGETTGGETGDTDTTNAVEEEEEAQLQLAMELSLQASEAAQTGELTKEELQAALKASVSEYDLERGKLEREQAELEHAIALSLASEADRIKKLEEANEQEKDAEIQSKKKRPRPRKRRRQKQS